MAELYVVHVMREFATREKIPKILEANLRFAENLGAIVVRLKGRSVADAIADFVRSKHITQVVFGRALVRDWKKISLPEHRPPLFARVPRCRRPHRHPGTGSRLTVGSSFIEKNHPQTIHIFHRHTPYQHGSQSLDLVFY